MPADPEMIKHLNAVLRNELTGINQYFLHARLLKHMGLMRLADYEYKESIDEMKHADKIVERIFFLGGLPNLQDLGKLLIGETVEEILRADLQLEHRAHVDLKAAITYAETTEDYGTSELLQQIQLSEEDHINFIETQLRLIGSMGLSAYLQTQVRE